MPCVTWRPLPDRIEEILATEIRPSRWSPMLPPARRLARSRRNMHPESAARCSLRRRCASSTATVASSSAIRRDACVLVSFTTVPPSTEVVERVIDSVRVLRSRSDQRTPLAATCAGRGQHAQQCAVLGVVLVGEFEHAFHVDDRRRVDLALAELRRRCCGRRIRRHDAPLHRLPERAPEHGVHVPDGGRGEAAFLRQHRVVVVEPLRRHPPETQRSDVGLDQSFGEAAVLAHGRRRQRTLDVVEPRVEELAERLGRRGDLATRGFSEPRIGTEPTTYASRGRPRRSAGSLRWPSTWCFVSSSFRPVPPFPPQPSRFLGWILG